MSTTDNVDSQRVEHWRRTKRLMITTLIIWFFFAYVIHWFAEPLHSVSFFGWPLGYYMAAQGSLAVFVILLFVFNRLQHAIDVEFGMAEDE